MPVLKNKENQSELEKIVPPVAPATLVTKEAVMKRFTEYILEIIKVVLISLAIIVPVRYFLIQPFYVKGASMEPNFFDHEYLIIDEISYRLAARERGDIVVFKYPRDTSQYFIKRIVGLPNETLEIKDGRVTVYNALNPAGLLLEENYLDKGVKTLGDRTVSLGSNEYFLLGDNRLASYDSRSFGAVKDSYIIGKVWLRGWPFDKIKVFETPRYNF